MSLEVVFMLWQNQSSFTTLNFNLKKAINSKEMFAVAAIILSNSQIL
jgi:hypothetical protein